MVAVSFEKYLGLLDDGLGSSAVSHYRKPARCHLSALCDRYGSDKGSLTESGHPYPWPAHNYVDYYASLFGHCRQYIRRVFECGLGTNQPGLPSTMGRAGRPGASLRVWRDYFPSAQVFGVDIDRSILFSEERIQTAWVDQTDVTSVSSLWQSNALDDFDLMVDDGLHTYEAGVTLFEGSVHRLADEGVYIIEDVSLASLLKFKRYFEGTDYRVEYVRLLCPQRPPTSDNSLVVIRNPDRY